MYLRKLQIDAVRCLKHVEMSLSPHLNVFVGHNGAGKTSVLEAVYLLSRGRSFRSGGADAMTQRGEDEFNIHAELHRQGNAQRIGVGRRQQRWQVRLNGETHTGLSALLGHCAVVCFEPGTHELIAGASEHRRRFLDWGVFHVEHGFLEPWRRYQRALRQRNALLRSGRGSQEQVQAWEAELGESGTRVDQHRAAYMARFGIALAEELARLVPELGPVQLHYRRGWDQDRELGSELQAQRSRDQQRGHTTVGAHRADWELSFPEAPNRDYLSRGQEKLVALGCVLAQAEIYAQDHNEWPIVCLDDLASELDGQHQQDVVSRLLSSGAQILATGTHLAAGIDATSARMFHVEHGRVTERST